MVELIVREGECVCFWASFFLCQVRVLLTVVYVICILFYL